MQRVALSPRWPMIQTSHHRHLLSFTTTPLTHFKTCGIFFKNLNVFSSGAKLKSIWLVVEKIWNVSNISPAPAWLLAPSPLPFVLVLLRSVLFCVLLRCPIGKTSKPTFPTFPTAAALHPGVIRRLQTQAAGAGWLQSMSLLFLPIPHLDRGSHFQLLRPHLDCDSEHCPCRGRYLTASLQPRVTAIQQTMPHQNSEQLSYVSRDSHCVAWTLVLQKVPSEANPKVRNHGEGPY